MNVGGDTRLVDMTIGELLDILENREIRLKAEIIEAIGPKQREEEVEYVYGLDGLMVLLGLKSKTTASKLVNGLLKPAVKRNGRTILVDKNKAIELFGR